MKTIQEIEREILLKEHRVAYWDKYKTIPTIWELINEEKEVVV